jgi:hypothetical protein
LSNFFVLFTTNWLSVWCRHSSQGVGFQHSDCCIQQQPVKDETGKLRRPMIDSLVFLLIIFPLYFFMRYLCLFLQISLATWCLLLVCNRFSKFRVMYDYWSPITRLRRLNELCWNAGRCLHVNLASGYVSRLAHISHYQLWFHQETRGGT